MKLGHFGFGRVTLRQLVLMTAAALVLALPLLLYIIFVVAPSQTIDLRQVGLVGLANMAVCVPLLTWIIKRWILKDKQNQ